MELFVKLCPEAVWHFVNIVEGREELEMVESNFDGLTFRQVAEGEVVFGGCPYGKLPEDHIYYRFTEEPESSLCNSCLGILLRKTNSENYQYFLTMADLRKKSKPIILSAK